METGDAAAWRVEPGAIVVVTYVGYQGYNELCVVADVEYGDWGDKVTYALVTNILKDTAKRYTGYFIEDFSVFSYSGGVQALSEYKLLKLLGAHS